MRKRCPSFNTQALATSGPDLVVSDPRGNLTTSKVYPSVDFWPAEHDLANGRR